MIRVTRIVNDGSRRAGEAWRSMQSQPSAAMRAATLVFAAVLAVPVILLLLLALLFAMLVFAVFWVVHAVRRSIRGMLPRQDGRKNVRVIERSPGSSPPGEG